MNNPTNTFQKPGSISKELGRKLFPLALLVFSLVSIFMPSIYSYTEYQYTKNIATRHAIHLAENIKILAAKSPTLWKYQSNKYAEMLNSFVPLKGISNISVLDENSEQIEQYKRSSQPNDSFWSLEIRGAPSPITFNNHKIGEVIVAIDANPLFSTSVLSFGICLIFGSAISILMYRFPMQITNHLELELSKYYQTIEENTKLELLNQQLQKNASLDRMAGAIAHHFNNQLGAVIGNLELALEDRSHDIELGKFLKGAMEGASRAAKVSGLLLTYLGQSPDRHAIHDLAAICRQIMPLLQAATPANLLIETDLPSPGPLVSTNVSQIQQLLTNLITNAWEGSTKNNHNIHLTVKTVSAQEIAAEHHFPIDWVAKQDRYACIEVSDSGCGIPEMDIDKIFDPFFTSKFTGRGLGLPAVLGIVKSHDGTVTVESVVDSGSSFKVYLPVSSETIPAQQGDPIEQTFSKKDGGTVMLIEDDELMREMASTMLTRLGYMVLPLENGIEALRKFREQPTAISVVLCDLSMPYLNGWQTLAALRQIRPDIPVILASGYEDIPPPDQGCTERPQVILKKPYQKKVLQDALARAMKTPA